MKKLAINPSNKKYYSDDYINGWENGVNAQYEATKDAVEVVRCKDCLMTKERDEYTGKVWCCRHREYMDDMYYCADGLRREDGEE